MPRCTCCKKKTHLELKCKCEKMFCSACLLPEVHTCTHVSKDKIELVKVEAAKVEKI
jgi:hypothetical protein